jgi:hypothetical protein
LFKKVTHGFSNTKLHQANPVLVADKSSWVILISITWGICQCHDEEAREEQGKGQRKVNKEVILEVSWRRDDFEYLGVLAMQAHNQLA